MEYYTYAYLRENGTPYYIGKGKGNRWTDKNGKNCIPPNDKSKIIELRELSKLKCELIGVVGRNAFHVFNKTNMSWIISSKELAYCKLFD